MNLIYKYPFDGTGSPSMVARHILNNLEDRRDELPFDNLILYTKKEHLEATRKQFSNLEVISYKQLSSINKNDIVHIPVSPYILPNSKFLLNLYALIKKNKLILHYHGDIRTEFINQIKSNTINLFNLPSYIGIPYVLRNADKLIVNSYIMSNLVKENYNAKNCAIIPNGIENFWFNKKDEIDVELEGDPIILYHGRLSKEKGVDLLIEGFSKSVGRSSKAKLYILGDGPQLKYLQKLCLKHEVEKKVTFLGYIEKVENYLSNADAAIYPSIFEAFSVAILEAFASVNGPVYYSSKAGIDDFVKITNYNLNSFTPTVANITEVVNNLINKNYDQEIIRKQKDFANQFTWEKVTSNYIKLYNDLID